MPDIIGATPRPCVSAARRAARAGGQGPSAVASRVVRFESRADGDLSSTHPSPPPPWSERVAPRTAAAAPSAAVRHGERPRPRPRPRPRRRERERRHVPPDRPRPQGGCDERAFWKRGVVGWWLWLAGRVSSSPQRRPCRAPRQQGRRAAPLGRLQRQGGLQPESRGRSAWQGGVGRPTHSTVERAEFHIAIGAPGFGVLVMWALRGGATSEMPGRAAALPASAPNWRRAESNLERAPQVGVNLESTSASWSQPGVALKTWSQHLKPGASSLQLERARSNWSELAPSWSEVGASGASEKKFSNVGPNKARQAGS